MQIIIRYFTIEDTFNNQKPQHDELKDFNFIRFEYIRTISTFKY